MKIFTPLLLILITFSTDATAEIRIWEDRAGNQYNAEFVRELFDKLTLRDADGTEYRIAADELSEHDQKYIRVMVPPVMEINFLKRTGTKPKPIEVSDDDNDTITLLRGRVDITKESKRPFTSGLTAELYLIGEEVDGDDYVLLDRFDSHFLFTQNDTHTFETKEIEMVVYTEYNNQRRGENYIGYLLAVSDTKGNVVQIKTDLNWLSDKVEQLRDLYTRSIASRYVRHFDKTGQKTAVPRPIYYGSRPR